MLTDMTSFTLDLERIEFDNEAFVVSRANRFLMIADVLTEEGSLLKDQKVHVHDPGRLKEIIYPGNRVRLRKASSPKRKTAWDLVFGLVGDEWVLVNSSFHRYIASSILKEPEICPIGPVKEIIPEVRSGSSRLDFKALTRDGRTYFIEVKGCTLSVDGRAFFPDAPTTRGTRHVRELTGIKGSGIHSAVFILVLAPSAMGFSPNRNTDPEFAAALQEAHEAGVEIYPLDLQVREGVVRYNGILPLILDE